MTNLPSPSNQPHPQRQDLTRETGGPSSGTGSPQTLAFPDFKDMIWWNSWWDRACGPEPSDEGSRPPQLVRFVGMPKTVPLDLQWDRIGPPSPTWPPRFLALWPEFDTFVRRPGMPTCLDPQNTWLVAAPSADRQVGHSPTLVSLPADQVPIPGSTIVARRPQEQTVSETFVVSPLGAFRLNPAEVLEAAPGAAVLGSALIGEVWRL